MSQQIDGIFSKYKKVFISDQEKIKKYLLTHYERALLTRQVINVERVDSTERIKISGFNKYLSSWRNFYQNIVVTSCVLINNVQKRYDYKFYFTKEKLDVTTIEKIERALEESARLRRNFKFEEAIAKIDEMLELIQKKKDEVTNKILNDARREIVAAQEKYDKNMIAISKLENKIKVAEDYDNLRDIPKNCENIIKLAESIGRNDLVKKYKGMKEDTQKEIGQRKAQEKQMALKEAKALAKRKEQESYDKAMAQIANLEEKIKIDRANGNLKAALIDCEKIINIANLIDKDDLIVKYSKLYESLGNELEAKEAREREMAIKSKESLKKQKAEQKRKALEAKEALKKQRAEQMRKALEAKETLKKQKALEAEEKHRALEAEEILKKQKALEAEEKQKVLEAEEKQRALEAEEALKKQKAEQKLKALEAKEALKKQKAEQKRKALEAKETLKKQKVLEAEEALKKQKVKEAKEKLEAENALKAQQGKERENKILAQIAAFEESVRKNQEDDNLEAVVSDCQQIISLANSIDRGDIAKKYRKIMMDNTLKLLKEIKAQETQKALVAEEALKKQRAKEAKEKLEAEKTLKAQQENERKNKALEQIEVLEESFRAYQEADDLNGVVTDCLLIIKLADSIGEEDIAAKYTGILDDAVKELENRKAQEKVKALEEKEALKRQKEALKQQKALEKQKALEAKNTLKAQQSEEKKSKILEQIAALEESIRAYQEAENLNGVVSDCQQIIKLANSIGEEDIAEKYREILDNALKELENQKAQEKVKAQEAKKAQKEAKDQEKYDKVLDQISKLEDNMNTNHANGNLSAALNDCKDIINLASRIGREYLVDKYSGILDELQKELEASEAIEMEKDLDDKWEESKIEGEYLFLIKDLILARIPNVDIVKLVREKEGNLFAKYKKELDDFFDNYDPNLQTTEETAELAALLLKPDIYDFLSLMRNNFYPLDKIPKILSEWADSDKILNELLDLNILTVIKASKKRKWLILLTDIKPLIVFPEHTFPNIRVAYKAKKITYEVAKKALDLMEVTFVEKLIF